MNWGWGLPKLDKAAKSICSILTKPSDLRIMLLSNTIGRVDFEPLLNFWSLNLLYDIPMAWPTKLGWNTDSMYSCRKFWIWLIKTWRKGQKMSWPPEVAPVYLGDFGTLYYLCILKLNSSGLFMKRLPWNIIITNFTLANADANKKKNLRIKIWSFFAEYFRHWKFRLYS